MRFFKLLVVWAACFSASEMGAREVSVESLSELMAFADQSGNVVRMKPGTYRLSDLATKAWIREKQEKGMGRFMEFSGDRNRFLLEDVVIEWETELRGRMRPPGHTGEIVITGEGNVLEGLEVRCVGTGISRGGQLVEILGKKNVLKGVRLEVGGSFPYGYGDAFGKGGNPVIFHYKHSGIRIAGDGARLQGCVVSMRSFGHGIFLQEDAKNVVIEDCEVVGEMRNTEEILAERKGPAFEKKFRTVFQNREGKRTLLPGYKKSLCEDGFRTYGEHPGLVLRRCKAKNVRGGFELRMDAGVLVEDCLALGCERGFWVSSRAKVKNCRVDASHGPALFLEGKKAEVELEILPALSDRITHGLAMISGEDHQLTLRASDEGERKTKLSIWVGYSAPPRGEGMSQFKGEAAKGIRFKNETKMPVRIGKRVDRLRLDTVGKVEANQGRRVRIQKPS